MCSPSCVYINLIFSRLFFLLNSLLRTKIFLMLLTGIHQAHTKQAMQCVLNKNSFDILIVISLFFMVYVLLMFYKLQKKTKIQCSE